MESLWSFIIVLVLLSFLVYSCQWCSKTYKMYHEALREIEENQQQNNEHSYSVYTVERGRSNLITYSSSNTTPRSQPTDDTIIKDFPPSYEEAIANNSTVIQVPTSAPNSSSLNQML